MEPIDRRKQRSMTRKFWRFHLHRRNRRKLKIKSFVLRNASPTNDNDNSSESDNSDGSSSGDSSSDENQKNESVTDWSLMAFVKRDVQPKPQIEPLPSLPVPEIKPEPDVKSSSTTRAGADSKKFLSPMCLNNEQIKQEPIGKCFVCQKKKNSSTLIS